MEIEHEFYDDNTFGVRANLDGHATIERWGLDVVLSKDDTIAIARAQGVTAEDLEG